jgi:hypothetical protein
LGGGGSSLQPVTARVPTSKPMVTSVLVFMASPLCTER